MKQVASPLAVERPACPKARPREEALGCHSHESGNPEK